MMARANARGFTLMELMIAVAVVGILAGVAVPSYREHIAASRRADAKSALLGAAQAMERYYTERGKYDGATLGSRKSDIYPAKSPQEYYSLSITSPGANGFKLLATRAGAQVGDKCGNYTYEQKEATAETPETVERNVELAIYTVGQCW